MSHNYPYRRLLPDSDLRPDPGPYSSSDRRHASPDSDFYRQPQESFSSSSFRGPQWSQDGALSILSSCGLEPSDLALLAELPEDVLTVESLPQVLHQIKGKRGTVKPFPPNAPSPSSFSSSPPYPHSSTRRSTVNLSTSDWDHGRSQPLQSLMDQVIPSPLLSDQDRWGNPRTSTSVRADSASSASGYMDFHHHRPVPTEYSKAGRDTGPVLSHDFHHRPGTSEYGKMDRDTGPVASQAFQHRPVPSEYGKTGRDAGRVSSQDFHHEPGSSKYGKTGRDASPVSPQERASFSSAGGGKRTRPSHLSQPGPADYKSIPPSEEYHLKTRRGRREPETSSARSSSRPTTSMPSEREALDFHGTCPPVFPYSCSLCDITVMSERVWIKHINGTQHADGQLSLLQQFPNWDCRMETVSRANNQSEKPKDEGRPGQQPQTASQSSTSQPNKKLQKKTSEKGKVVCVKFPAQSVDEMYLRKLVEPFGKIVKILMFPSLAFVELGSIDQAKDLVKFHVNYPPTVNGEQMEFRISKTFSFLQSSRVVSFTPAPTGENGQSDLISIVKRFGSPLYTLFLPSMAFVEMKNTPDAQKLVDYYSSNTLRINNDIIKVSFSGEYKSLMRVASAKRYEEEMTKRKRSSSREKEDKSTESKRRRRSSKEEEKEGEKSSREKTRTRSRSREKSMKEKKTRTRSRSREKSTKEKTTTTRSRSRDKSCRDGETKSRSKSREKSKEKSGREKRSRSRDKFGRDGRTRTRSKSREKSSRTRRSRSTSRSGGKSGVPEKIEQKDSESRTDPDPAPVRNSKPEAEENEQSGEEAESSAEESDIEGMEVIGEDGENLEDDMETLDDADAEKENVEEEEKKDKMEEAHEKDSCPAERTDSSKEDKEEVKEREQEERVMEKKVKKEKPTNEKTTKEEEEEEQKKNVKEEEEDQMCGKKNQEEESEQTADTQLEDDEGEPDFPVDLENCITLDELEEEQSDKDEKVRHEPKSPSNRVVYFRNLPLRSYADAEFIKLVRDFGTAVRYFHKPPSCGFIEMSTSSEALRAVKELSRKPVIFNGSKLIVQMSNKYKRLNNGWEVQLDEDSDKEKRSECRSQSSRRSGRQNKNESDRKAEGKKELSKKTPEKESKSQKTPEKESRSEKTQTELVSKITNKKSSQKDSVSRNSSENKSLEKEAVGKTSSEETSKTTAENESVTKKTSEKDSATELNSEKESVSRKTPGKESFETSEKTCRTTAEEESTSEQTDKDSAEKVSPANKLSEKELLHQTSQENEMLKQKETHENDSVPEKKKKELVNDVALRKQELEAAKAPEEEKLEKKGSEDDTCGPGLKDSESPDRPDSTGDPPKSQTEQKPADGDSLQHSDVPVEQQSGPAEGAAELQKPTKPVGTEFVRPVVGYFCNLCQLIYADEDEAKLQHCSSLTHYRKYQEKTGKDPWAS